MACRGNLLAWTYQGQVLPGAVLSAAEAWLDAHPDAVGVASAEGRMLAIRPEHNHYARHVWDARIHVDPAFRAQVVCTAITGYPPELDRLEHVMGLVRRALEPRPVAILQTPRPVRARTLGRKIASFLRAELGGDVGDEIAAARLAQCAKNECGYLRIEGEKLYCTACGCPRWRESELHRKTRMAKAECPCEPPYWTAVEPAGGSGREQAARQVSAAIAGELLQEAAEKLRGVNGDV